MRILAIAALLLFATGARAQEPAKIAAPVATATTQHELMLRGQAGKVTATAGMLRLNDAKSAPLADLAFIAFQETGAEAKARPVTFVFNGGPGAASGWLQLGAVGPWRVALDTKNGVPSGSPELLANAESWLDFTDLVFIDPPGTGHSRILATADEARRRVWSVDGDIEILSEAIRRWLDQANRSVSPKFILGESYGGFRGPRLVRRLQSYEGVGIAGLILLSPLLDTHEESGFINPFGWVDRLPSEVAAARAAKGPVTRESVADAEAYAGREYLTDLVRGERDTAATARMSERVAALTGLDPALVRRYRGRIDTDVFLHELGRAEARVASMYDATQTIADPFPHRALSNYPDPTLEGFVAPVTSGMVALIAGKLNWRPDSIYHLSNESAFGAWDWGKGMGRPQSVGALQMALALDPGLRVLIAHGLFDLRTPYFTSARIVASLPDDGLASRVRLTVYPGGHMFYARDASRAAFRDDARALYPAAGLGGK